MNSTAFNTQAPLGGNPDSDEEALEGDEEYEAPPAEKVEMVAGEFDDLHGGHAQVKR